MNATEEKNAALKLLDGLENGGITTLEAFTLAEQIDPVLVYFIVRFLRETYPATDPAAPAVLERVVRLTSDHPEVIGKSKTGERDSMREWFDSEYVVTDYRGRGNELIEMISEKLDS